MIHYTPLLILRGVFLAVFFVLIFAAMATRPDPLDVGELAPEFTLPNILEQEISLADAKGKVTLVMFWASWCHPCMKKMPDVQTSFEQYNEDGFQVIAVNFGESESKVREIIKRFNITFPVVMDRRGNVAADYRVLGLPLSFFVDQNGIIGERVFGRTMTQEDIHETVIHYLSETQG